MDLKLLAYPTHEFSDVDLGEVTRVNGEHGSDSHSGDARWKQRELVRIGCIGMTWVALADALCVASGENISRRVAPELGDPVDSSTLKSSHHVIMRRHSEPGLDDDVDLVGEVSDD